MYCHLYFHFRGAVAATQRRDPSKLPQTLETRNCSCRQRKLRPSLPSLPQGHGPASLHLPDAHSMFLTSPCFLVLLCWHVAHDHGDTDQICLRAFSLASLPSCCGLSISHLLPSPAVEVKATSHTQMGHLWVSCSPWSNKCVKFSESQGTEHID